MNEQRNVAPRYNKFRRGKTTRSRNTRKVVEIPRILKHAAKILRLIEGGETINNCIHSSKSRNIRRLYFLVNTAAKNEDLLNELLIKTGLCNKDFDSCLMKIFVTELLWGKKTLPGTFKVSEAVRECQSQLEKAVQESSFPVLLEKVIKPRFARVNTILSTVEGTINCLKDDGWILLDTPDSYEKFLNCAVNLNEKEFLKDFHFDDLLVLSPKTAKEDLQNLKMVENYKLILQDKSAYLPPLLLNPPPGSTVLDMCAAPGMKTAHLAALMKNQGCLYAVDIDVRRLGMLNTQIPKLCGKHNCVTSLVKDCKLLTADECPRVKYILIDPASSGTGTSIMSGVDQLISDSGITSKRLETLCRFQERLLVQALTEFPSVERVVYSTCSVMKEENEEVIKRVLAKVPEFCVVPASIAKWEKRGDDRYEFGPNCLVANDAGDLMNGCFVAVLERIHKKEDRTQMADDEVEEGWMKPKKKQRKRKSVAADLDDGMVVESEDVAPKKKKESFKASLSDSDDNMAVDFEDVSVKKKRKKKKNT